MSWLIWRQHRGELAGAMALLAVLGLLLVTHGIPMHEAYDRDGVAACQAQTFQPEDDCADTVMAFTTEYANLPDEFGNWLPFLPMLAGMLVGAPLLARELEQGTWQLAWTQGVTRTRWLVTKLAAVFGGVLAASVVFAAGLSWWMGPASYEPQQFTTDKFNHTVLVFPAYVLLAVAIGVLAGVVVRRTIAAAAIVVGGYLAVRLPVEFGLRPRLREPLTTEEPGAVSGWFINGYQLGPDGPTQPVRYHPDSRFWQFQLIEVAILAAITLVLLLITWRLVLGRRPPAQEATPLGD